MIYLQSIGRTKRRSLATIEETTVPERTVKINDKVLHRLVELASAEVEKREAAELFDRTSRLRDAHAVQYGRRVLNTAGSAASTLEPVQ